MRLHLYRESTAVVANTMEMLVMAVSPILVPHVPVVSYDKVDSIRWSFEAVRSHARALKSGNLLPLHTGQKRMQAKGALVSHATKA